MSTVFAVALFMLYLQANGIPEHEPAATKVQEEMDAFYRDCSAPEELTCKVRGNMNFNLLFVPCPAR